MPLEQANLASHHEGADVAALLGAGAALGAAHANHDANGRTYATVPEGYKLVNLPERGIPPRPIATVKLRDATSFCVYFNDHKVQRSRIYAALDPARFLAVFDDFDTQPTKAPPPESAPTSLGEPDEFFDVSHQADWRQFRADFSLPASREWKTWTGKNGKAAAMNQQAFAEFLLDNMPDVVKPSGAEILDMVNNFEATTGGIFASQQRLQNGDTNITITAATGGASTLKLPEHIELAIPVFELEGTEPLTARLRYRANPQSGLVFWYELVRPHKVLEQAFRDTWERIAAATCSTLLLGSPE